jgi:hypothetical protein
MGSDSVELNLNLKRGKEIANYLLAVLVQLDVLTAEVHLEELEVMSHKLREPVRILEALPFPKTLNKAEELKRQCDVFDAFVDLVRARLEQKAAVERGAPFADGDEILHQMGLV